MTPEEAIRLVRERFPFAGYMSPAPGAEAGEDSSAAAYLTIADTVRRHLGPGATILDFGCGPADKTAVLQQLGYQCSACDDLRDYWHQLGDNRERILAFARECGIDYRLAVGGPLPFAAHAFDMVMLHDVLEHLHDSPRDLLLDLLELARPEGLLFVTVPNAVNIKKRLKVLFGRTNLPRFDGYYWYPGPWRGHVREYVRDDLVQLARFLNLEVLDLRGCDHMLHKVPAPWRLAYVLLTNLFPGWKDSWLLVARKVRGWAPRRSLPREELARILGTTPARLPAPAAEPSCQPR